DADLVLEKIENGDENAERAWEGMIYQICKQIGAMAAVLEGKAEAILLTGGLVRYRSIVEGIERRCGWIAPVRAYPGELEMEALAEGALSALRGIIVPKEYTGEPVFFGFSD
ncbi:MAG: butyrate kinase, partial [Oscillospiraceae bacterium]|nr:butyrate kinase [Oscillospiraceae bacterium]